VRVPEEAADGKAKVFVSFAAWKVRDVKSSTTELAVITKPKEKKVEKDR
jgi:hypothetical protein